MNHKLRQYNPMVDFTKKRFGGWK